MTFVEEAGKTTVTMLGVPTFLRRDTTDDLLDPTTGTRSSITMTPWTSVAGEDATFFSAKVTGSAYHGLDEKNRYILAGFASVGTILGPSRDRIPPDKRL